MLTARNTALLIATLGSLALPVEATPEVGPNKSVPICYQGVTAKWRAVRRWFRANSTVNNCKPPAPWHEVDVPASGWSQVGCNDGGHWDCRSNEVYTQLSTATTAAREQSGGTGPTGPMGPQGPVGPMGPAGLPGVDGAAGPMGPAGPVGPVGPQGPLGLKGDKGDTGATGAQGLKGDTGATGAQGLKGETGAKGDTGAQGLKGDTGATGAKGDTGAQGLKGDKGDTGADGAAGAAGSKGDTGAVGPVGPAGPTGPAAPGVSTYANAEGEGNWGPTLSVAEHGSYVVMAKVQLTPNAGSGPIATINCKLTEIAVDGDILHDETTASAPVPDQGASAVSLGLQASVNVPSEGTVFIIECKRSGYEVPGLGTGFRYANSKVQALKVEQLFAPSP